MIRDHLPSVPIKWRFYIAHGFLAACAGALVFIAAWEIATPDNAGSSSGRTTASDAVGGGSTPSPAASTLSGTAASFQDYANQAAVALGEPHLTVVDCIDGADGTVFCSFKLKGVCHAALMKADSFKVVQAGQVGLSPSECNARNALKWIGENS